MKRNSEEPINSMKKVKGIHSINPKSFPMINPTSSIPNESETSCKIVEITRKIKFPEFARVWDESGEVFHVNTQGNFTNHFDSENQSIPEDECDADDECDICDGTFEVSECYICNGDFCDKHKNWCLYCNEGTYCESCRENEDAKCIECNHHPDDESEYESDSEFTNESEKKE